MGAATAAAIATASRTLLAPAPPAHEGVHRRSYWRCSIKAMAATSPGTEATLYRERVGRATTPRTFQHAFNHYM
ncbi:hypothetical protein Sjap_000343 [Stephania japonica]|uniref:Uncharacterized protein n=1 Tax=Stephania japonica TaxID=461633 RepID=A0AAP0KHU1_9MAGN